MDSLTLADKVTDRLGGTTPMTFNEDTGRYELNLHPIVLATLAVLVDEGYLDYAQIGGDQ